MAKTESRDEKLLFIDPPLYQTAYQLAVRSDDQIRVSSWGDIRVLGPDGVILINSDETNADFLRAQGGLTLDASATNTTLNLRKLMLRRGRFYFASTLSLTEEVRALNLVSDVKILSPRFQPSNVYAVFSRHAPRAMVDRVAEILVTLEKKGELNKIRRKYMELR